MKHTLSYGKNYSGKAGNKCWMARINGTSDKFGLDREFLEADKVERDSFTKSRTMIHFTYDIEAGLYEVSENGEREIICIYVGKDGDKHWYAPSDDRIKAILAKMEDGMTADEARLATVAPKIETPAK